MKKKECYKIHMNRKSVIESLDNFINKSEYKMNVVGDTIEFSKQSERLLVEIAEKEMEDRTFSAVEGVIVGVLIQLKKCSNLEVFESLLSKINFMSRSYSDDEIQAIIRDMPILSWYSQKNSIDLSNVAIIWRDHFLEENIGLLMAFCNMGIKPNNILALDKGDFTKHHMEITATFDKLGFNVDVFDNEYIDNEEYLKNVKDRIERFISERKNQQIIVLDDGAIVTKFLEHHQYTNLVAAIELTEMGLRRMKHSDLQIPVFNIAKTKLKRLITYPEIANSIFIRIIELLGGEKSVGRTMLLCGYGDMGEILAERFRGHGVQVCVYDNDVFRLIIAAERGYKTYRNPVIAVEKEKPFLVVGASGERSITSDMIEKLGSNTYVTAGATADLNVMKEYKQDKKVLIAEKKKYGTQFWVNDKKITMFGNGRSINLFDSEAIPNMSIEIFKAELLITVCKIIENKDVIRDLKGVNLELVEEWINDSGLYDYYYSKYYEC